VGSEIQYSLLVPEDRVADVLLLVHRSGGLLIEPEARDLGADGKIGVLCTIPLTHDAHFLRWLESNGISYERYETT